MEVNVYNDLNISNSSIDTNSTSPHNTNGSLFNSLLAKNDANEEIKPKNERVKEAMSVFNRLKEDVTITSNASDTSNTHDELTLMLELKKLQAS